MSDCCATSCGCDSNDKEVRVAKDVPKVSSYLTFSDKIGSCKARWGIGRMKYVVKPGIYALGSPEADSPVLVTANYKMTFDVLRKELVGLDAWILILDTNGINVWCAAGKGTFGTQELLKQIAKTDLEQIVTHRTLILPQLGAPGVNAHEIAKQSGFRVVYGPVRAKDVKEFIQAGMRATDEMRRVNFTTYDRLVLTPIEIVGSLKPAALVIIVGFFLNYFSLVRLGIVELFAFLGALTVGVLVTPILLPWIPGRAFAFKGWFLGMVWALATLMMIGQNIGLLRGIEFLLILPAVSAFLAMNFTGASTYTSLSGVMKEMKIALPIIVGTVGMGIILLIVESILSR